jgi:hypothetical protein
MTEPSNQRRYPRVSTSGRDYGIRFSIVEQEVLEARMANLSASGCGLEVPMGDAWSIDIGTNLEGIYIDHPDVPYVPLQGTVVRVLGKIPGKMVGYVLVGVDFNKVTDLVQGLIRDHVDQRLAETEG